MAEVSMKNSKIKLLFENDIDIDYYLHDSVLADKWANKIKHLQNVPIDTAISNLDDFTNLAQIYSEFCEFANLQPISLEPLDQQKLNQLHRIYEDNHDRLSRLKNNSIIYKLHHSIHFHEDAGTGAERIQVSWGKYEGALTNKYRCYDYYENSIIKNNIYLPWAELGKTPISYWGDGEPNDQARFNQLAKPHTTFRAMFFIATADKMPTPFDPKFVEWFENYKEGWYTHHGITEWNNILEDSAPLLATTDYKGSMKNLKFLRIIV